MRVLLTGASGFVGGHTVAALHEHGHQILAWSSGDSQEPDVASVDLRDANAVKAADLSGVDAVIHLAGLAAVADSFRDPARYLAANPGMQANLMEALLDQDVRARVLIVSTGGVYAARRDVLTEEAGVAPSNPYVISKLTQEQVAWYYAKRGFETIVARPFNHIGPGQQRGYLVSDVASQLVELERTGGGQLALGNLQSVRDFTDVRDVARAYVRLVEDGHPGQTYNVCSGVSRSGADVVEHMRQLVTADVQIVQKETLLRPTDVSEVHASNAKLRRDVNWQPAIPLNVTLSDVIDDWRSR